MNLGVAGYFELADGADGQADADPDVERRIGGDAGRALPVPAGPDRAPERLHAGRQAARARRTPRRAAQVRVPGRRADRRRPRSARRRRARGHALGLHGQRQPRARRRRRHPERPALGAGAELLGPAARHGVREQRRLRHQRARQSLGQRRADRPAQPRDVLAPVHDGRGAAPPSRPRVPRDRGPPRGGAHADRAALGRAASGAQRRQQLAADEPRAADRDPALPRPAGSHPPRAARRAPQLGRRHRPARHLAQGHQHRARAGRADASGARRRSSFARRRKARP